MPSACTRKISASSGSTPTAGCPTQPEVRRSRRLVISSIATVENYEYGFFWYLYQDGNIQFEIKLTGILSLGTLRAGREIEVRQPDRAAALCAESSALLQRAARLRSRRHGEHVQQIDVVADELGAANPFENAFRARATLLLTEKQAARQSESGDRAHLEDRQLRRQERGRRAGRLQVLPGRQRFPLASPNAWWRKRAGFVNHHVWVTPYRAEEKHAAGDYPNQSQGGDGLTKWTEDDRPIANTDVVLWYTFGHTHIPRPEDYPVMPTAYIGFLLKPNGFFDQNPANDVPPSKTAGGSKSCCHE